MFCGNQNYGDNNKNTKAAVSDTQHQFKIKESKFLNFFYHLAVIVPTIFQYSKDGVNFVSIEKTQQWISHSFLR